MGRKILVVFSLSLALSLALAGCGNKITAEEIVAKMQETIESTTDAHAVVTANINAQGLEMWATAEVWEKMPNQVRADVLDASEPEYVGTTLVSDGEQAWLYEPSSNVVMVGPMGEVDVPLPQEMITSLREVIQAVLDASDVELAGQEEVSGHEVYKLTLSPKEDAELELFPGGGTATLWVDKEQWIVLKATYEGGTLFQGSMEVQSFELNPGLPESLFHFEAPEGAQVIDVEAQEPVPLTLDEAREQAGFPLLVPEYVPEGATLVEVLQMGDSFILRYDHSPDISFTVAQGSGLSGFPPQHAEGAIATGMEGIEVRGRSAEVIVDEAGGNTFLHWDENDITITVAGHISLDEALKVAESLK